MSAARDVGTARLAAASNRTPPSPQTLDPGHSRSDIHRCSAGVDHLSSEAIEETPTTDSPPRSTPDAVGQSLPEAHTSNADGYLALRAIAEVYEDIQRVRIAVFNRIDHAPIDSEILSAALGGIATFDKSGKVNGGAEHRIALLLRRTFRKVVEPEIVGWQAATIGVGEHMLARLLGVIGHPVHTTVHDWEGDGDKRVLVVKGQMERRVSDLWSYCGHGDPTRRKRKGMSVDEAFALGSPRAKMIVHLMAESCLKAKARSPYGPVYDFARAKYQDREGWTLLHQHNAALRLVGKEILRDLWTAAR